MDFMTISLKREVSLVLLPIDDFTEQIITGSQIRMYTEEGNRPSIRKADGYHVFCGLPDKMVRICIDGPLYQKQTLEFPTGYDGNVYQVRMLPAAGYTIPSGATCVKGRLKPGSRMRLFFQEPKKSYKLLYDYEPGKQGKNLSLYCPDTARLEGRTLYITEQGKEGEYFRVAAKQQEICRLEEPLHRKYKKIGTSVYPVYEVYAGNDGSFYLPVRSIPADGRCICMIAGKDGKEKMKELTLTAGKENYIYEEEEEK